MTDQTTQQHEYKGYNGTFILTDTAVIIKRGVKGFLLGGGKLRGDKTIPYKSIVAVQFKKAGLVAGYIQLTLAGGSEAKGGFFQTTTDENSINFHSTNNNNSKFEEAKRLIEEHISGGSHSLNDLDKLAELKNKGVITEEEFTAKKKKILQI